MKAVDRLLDDLHVEAGDVVFLHTSFGRLRSYVGSVQDMIEAMLVRLGQAGTLVMPRYAWHLDKTARPWKGYRDFLESRPVVDLRHTPANIGVVPEVFRHMGDVRVSTSYFWPICALGKHSLGVIEGQEKIGHAYGPGSSFARLLVMDARIVGLGVTLNTSSIAPVTDCFCRPIQAFTERPICGQVIDTDGDAHEICCVTLRPETVRDMRPSVVLTQALLPGRDFPHFIDADGSVFFSYPAQTYHRAALQMVARTPGRIPWLPAVSEGSDMP